MLCSLLTGIFLAISLTSSQAVASSEHAVITIPEWTAQTSCRIVIDGVTVATEKRHSFEIDCAAKATVVSCDADAAEPIEVSADVACRLGTLPFIKAVPRQINTGVKAPVRIAWIQALSGHRPSIIAWRDVVGPEASINVTTAPGRYIRFIRDRSAPITIDAATLDPSRTTDIPSSLSGGEIFLVGPDAPIQPRRFVVRKGEFVVTATPKQGLVSVSNLPPGVYEVKPVYEDRLFGSALHVEVAVSKTSTLVTPRDNVGGAHVLFDPSICTQIQEVIVTEITATKMNNEAMTVERPVFRRPMIDNSCETTILGLAPGRFSVSARRGASRVGTADTEVSAQSISEVTVGGAGIRVLAHVERDGKPFGGFLLFTLEAGTSAAQKIRVANGDALFDVDREGAYDVDFTDASLPFSGQQRVVRVTAGDNRFTWKLSTASIHVEVIGYIPGDKTFLKVSKVDDPSQSFSRLLEGPTLDLPGVAFGSYTLSLLLTTKAVKPVTVTLDKDHPKADATLVLEDHSVLLTVLNEFGRPDDDAEVITKALSTKRGTGEFEFEGLLPGDTVIVTSPTHSPACRIVPPAGDLVVTLLPGRSITLELGPLEPGKPSDPPPTVFGAPGSDCGVQTTWMARGSSTRTDNGAIRIPITQFPNAASLTLLTRSGTQIITAGQSLVQIK